MIAVGMKDLENVREYGYFYLFVGCASLTLYSHVEEYQTGNLVQSQLLSCIT